MAGQIPVLGTIFNPDGASYQPVFTQPGGPFTPVFPQQSIGEMLGLFVFGCGHWFNNIDVKACAVGGVSSAILCCPVCSYVQAIITPYSNIYTFGYEILIA